MSGMLRGGEGTALCSALLHTPFSFRPVIHAHCPAVQDSRFSNTPYSPTRLAVSGPVTLPLCGYRPTRVLVSAAAAGGKRWSASTVAASSTTRILKAAAGPRRCAGPAIATGAALDFAMHAGHCDNGGTLQRLQRPWGCTHARAGGSRNGRGGPAGACRALPCVAVVEYV